MPLRIATGTRNTIADAVANLIGTAGTLKIYTGTQPATPGDTATGTLLATVTLGSWTAATSGTASGADPASVNAVATGTAGWFRGAKSDGTVVLDGDVSATGGGGVMQLSSTSIVSGGAVDITSVSITAPGS